MLRTPPPEVLQLSFGAIQPSDNPIPVRLHPLDERTSRLRDILAQRRDLNVPGLGRRTLMPQCRVPLPHRPPVAHPPICKPRFHVEHCPVEPPPPSPSALL